MAVEFGRLEKLLEETAANPPDEGELNFILAKARMLRMLSEKEIAQMLALKDAKLLEKVYAAAGQMKERMFDCSATVVGFVYVEGDKTAGVALSTEELVKRVNGMVDSGLRRIVLWYSGDTSRVVNDVSEVVRNTGVQEIQIACPPMENDMLMRAVDVKMFVVSGHCPDIQSAQKNQNFSEALTIFGRALGAGVKDVGINVLIDSEDMACKVLTMVLFNRALETEYGQGYRTISFHEYMKGLRPDEIKKIVSIMRLAVPYVNIAVAADAYKDIDKLLSAGLSEVWLENGTEAGELASNLLASGHISSFCTSCHTQGRTGAIYQQHLLKGALKEKCFVNSATALAEYILDRFSDSQKRKDMLGLLDNLIKKHENESARKRAEEFVDQVMDGERGLRWDDIGWQINIKLTVNGEMKFFKRGITLNKALESLRMRTSQVKLNDSLINEGDFESTVLKTNDNLEITANI